MRDAGCGMRGRVVTTHLASRISHPVAPTFRRRMDYSYRKATIGSRLAARRAGQMQKNSPTAELKTNASRIASGEMRVLQWDSLDRYREACETIYPQNTGPTSH